MTLDVVFPALGTDVSVDHSYPLYAALSGLIPQFHDDSSPLRFAPITGMAVANGRLQLGPGSCLRVRVPGDAVKTVLPLAGKKLAVADSNVRLGAPAIQPLRPAPVLIARLVTIKNADSPEEFLAAARQKLVELGASGEPQLPVHLDGDRAGEPKRRVVRIKGVVVTGYSLIVADLSDADSLRIQQIGLGGRTRMGCGFFLPATGGR